MPSSFDPGFAPGLGGNGQAQLVLIVGSNSTYQDGDILHAFNRRRIRHVHADNICHVQHLAFNGDGLNPLDSLPEHFQKSIYQYKFERISATEVRRTDLDTLDELVFSAAPISVDGHMEHMNVELFVQRRRVHPRHRIFGTNGSEVWYGGRTNAAWDRLSIVWGEIEARTANREENFTKYPLSERTLKRHLVIYTNDFDDAMRMDLESPLQEKIDPGDEFSQWRTLSKRKSWVTWRDLPDVVEANVLDKAISVDMHGRKQVRQSIVNTRTV